MLKSLNHGQTLSLVLIALVFSLCSAASKAACLINLNAIDVCDLQGSHTIAPVASSQNIPFSIQSTYGGSPRPFGVRLATDAGGSFQLQSSEGERIEIKVSLKIGEEIHRLQPDQYLGEFSRSRNVTDADLIIELDANRVFSSSLYTGNFSLTVIQPSTSPGISYTTEFSIVLSVEPEITIQNLGDIALIKDGTTAEQALSASEDFCIGGKGFSQYQISLSSSNGGSGDFRLKGSEDSLAYSVVFSDNLLSYSGSSPDTSGKISTNFELTSPPECGSDNARLTINVPSSEWRTASEAKYTDILTITVAAQ
ncbi:hypothetical protein ACJJIK_10910 [Microbulbifer sp. ZKSA006]|uniref:hypothetical protein n=1 Tax=Microbulbifer sp. ZKSA006 TaxID=3243390 RepID=UPI004039EB03